MAKLRTERSLSVKYDFDSLYLCMYWIGHLREIFVGPATCTLEILAKQKADLLW